MGENLSAALSGPFHQLRAGIHPDHRLPAAREMALSTPQLQLGRFLAFRAAQQEMALSTPQQQFRGPLAFLAAQLERGTPMDGNCLYHAVNQARGGTADLASAAALRQQVVNWALDPANLPTVTHYATLHGVRPDDLIATMAQNGNWSGTAGDLVPRMIAATLGITLVIHQGSTITNVPPLSGGSTRSIDIDLADQHYSVHRSDTGNGNGQARAQPGRARTGVSARGARSGTPRVPSRGASGLTQPPARE